MNITPWTLYWILKLDDIREAMTGPALLLCGLCLAGNIMCVFISSIHSTTEGERRGAKTVGRLFLPGTVLFILTAIIYPLVPSTKQMAAIITVPAIANSEFVTATLPKEGRELYELTKQWLGDQVKKTPIEKEK